MNIWHNAKYIPVSCPNIITFYNNGMDGVDIMDQKTPAYRLDLKSKYHFYLSMFFDLMDVTHVNSHSVYMKLGDYISLLNIKLLQQKLWLVDIVIVIDRSPLLDWASESLMNHPWPEKSQPTCVSSSRSGWDVIARMKAQTQIFCVLSGLWPVLMLVEREKLFFEASFVVFHHNFIPYYISFRK